MSVLAVIGFVLCLIGIYKMKYGGQTFKGLFFAIIGLVFIFFGTAAGGEDNPNSSGIANEIKQEIKDEIRDEAAQRVVEGLDNQPQDSEQRKP